MKHLYLIILLISSAFAQEECDEFGNAVIRSLQVPNCLSATSYRSQLQISELADVRRENNLPIPANAGPICGTCRENFSKQPVDAIPKNRKQDAFFEISYKELEKSLTDIAIDLTSLRSSWTMGTNFLNSLNSCDSSQIERGLERCQSPFLARYRNKNLSNRLGNEIASLISSRSNTLNRILNRPASLNNCPVSDVTAANLKQFLFEDELTDETISKILTIDAETAPQLKARLGVAISEDFATLVENHPILRNLMQNPSLFKQAFSRVARTGSRESIINSFRSVLASEDIGRAFDEFNAKKCKDTISTFTNSLCSDGFKTGNVSLGPFQNYRKYLNGANPQLSETEVSSTDSEINNNAFALEFCNSSAAPNLSLGESLRGMNNWMPQTLRAFSLDTYATEKYDYYYGRLKTTICSYNGTCNDDSLECRVYKRYMSETPESRITRSADPRIDRVLKSLIGNPASLSSDVKQVLIAEGILPQANGSFVEREQPPERDPGYLSGVANGTITPNTGSSITGPSRQTRPQPGTSQGQQAVFQPQAQGNQSASAATTQSDTSEDDSLDRQVFEDLEARRLRGDQLSPQQTRQLTQLRPRFEARRETEGRTISGSPSFTQQPQAFEQTSAVAPALPSSVNPNGAQLDSDPRAQTRAERDRNAALAQMSGAKSNPFASGDADRGPAGTAESQAPSEQTIALTFTGDIRANLERVLNGEDSRGADLRNKLREKVPFRFQLNNSLFDVQFTNGTCVVTARNRDARSGELARELQGIFNNNLRRPATSLETLRQTLPN